MKTIYIVGAFVAELGRFIPAITNTVHESQFTDRELANKTLEILRAEQPGIEWAIQEESRDVHERVRSWAS